jgi:putative aldouronate transport system substrate-binding protein
MDIKILFGGERMKRIGLVLVILVMTVGLAFGGGGSAASSGPAATKVVRVEIFDRGTDGGRSLAHNNAWTNWIKDKVKKDLGIDVTFEPVGRWSEETDMTNLMASQSAPDLCYSYSTNMINNYRDQGGIFDLGPYVDSYLPDLKKLLGEDPAFPGKDFIYRNQIQANEGNLKVGQIYFISSARVALAQRNIFIRKDWLDKLGIPVPTTLDQFYAALTAFRARATELPGNLTQARVVPFFQGSDTRWGLADFMNNSITATTDKDRWVYSVAERNLAMPGYKEGVRLMNKWYNERLIYQDFPLVTVADDGNNILKSGVAGAFAGNWDMPFRGDSKINEDLVKNVPGASFIAIDIGLKNKDMMDKTGLHMFIPSFAKNAIAAMQYLNWLSKPENYQFLQNGNAGVNHTIVGGVPQRINRPAGDPWFMNSADNIDMTMPLNGIQMGNQDLNSRVLALSYAGVPAETIVNAYNASVKNARAPVVKQITTTVNQYTQTLQDKATALLAQSIRATPAQFDNVWDTGYRDWLASGAQEVINERNSKWR